MVAWQEAQALVRRRQLEQAASPVGLDEVWLAGPTVIEDAYLTVSV